MAHAAQPCLKKLALGGLAGAVRPFEGHQEAPFLLLALEQFVEPEFVCSLTRRRRHCIRGIYRNAFCFRTNSSAKCLLYSRGSTSGLEAAAMALSKTSPKLVPQRPLDRVIVAIEKRRE